MDTKSILIHKAISIHTANDILEFETIERHDTIEEFMSILNDLRYSSTNLDTNRKDDNDIFGKVQKLGELRDYFHTTEDEFAKNKAELLSRL